MRDELGSGSFIHLAWMCLFSFVTVRSKLGLAHGATVLAQPGFDPLQTGYIPALSHEPAHLKDAGIQKIVGGMLAACLGNARCHDEVGRPAWAPCPGVWHLARGSDLTLGLQHGEAKVLEKTFEEWMRYRDECLRRMASEPFPPGTWLRPSSGGTWSWVMAGDGTGFYPPSSILYAGSLTEG